MNVSNGMQLATKMILKTSAPFVSFWMKIKVKYLVVIEIAFSARRFIQTKNKYNRYSYSSIESRLDEKKKKRLIKIYAFLIKMYIYYKTYFYNKDI